MKPQIENILAEIRSSANSLEIFAWSATNTRFPADHQREMQDACLMMLERLQELHGELKQAMEMEARQ
jgi:hypothetical protein